MSAVEHFIPLLRRGRCVFVSVASGLEKLDLRLVAVE